ncbi:MAG: ABC transporter permease [Dehalococcoidia bacterium]|nr:ABC transporter permease [Dehalococcoidia bacterium]
MLKYVIGRVLGILPSVFLLVFLVVAMVQLIPGNIIDLMLADSPSQTLQSREELTKELGLDKPLAIRYGTYMVSIVQGDFGRSLWTSKPVSDLIVQYAPPTIQLAAISIVIGAFTGILLGVVSALKQDSWVDYILRSMAIGGISVPNFAIATAAVIFPALLWGIAPNLSYVSFTESPFGNLKILLLPGAILALGLSTSLMRLMRTTMLDVLRQDYIRTARAKGLGEMRVVSHHAVRNAVIPVVTLLGLQIAFLLGGSVIVETIFSIPGVGRLLVSSIAKRDYPIVQGIVVVIGLFVMFTNLLVDLSYGFLDPRIRIGR